MKHIILIQISLLFLISCSSQIHSADSGEGPPPDILANQELFDPETLSDKFVISLPSFEKYEKVNSGKLLELGLTNFLSDSSAIDSSLSVPGYRIQIFNGPSYSLAEEAYYNALTTIIDEPVYLKYYSPYYKIRVGNYLQREEADLYRIQTLRRLYPDSWIVPTKIYPFKVTPRVMLDDSLLFPDATIVEIDTSKILLFPFK